MAQSKAALEQEMREAQEYTEREPKTYVANILPQQHWCPRSYGPVIVKACPEGAPYEVTEIVARRASKDMGDKRTEYLNIPSKDVAADAVREINGNAGKDSFQGVFICSGPVPTQQEIAEAHEKLRKFYEGRVAKADMDYEAGGLNRYNIDGVDRAAAKYLNLKKPWLYNSTAMEECPACAEQIKPGVAVCRACGAILDKEKAEKFGLIEPVVVESVKPSRGRKAEHSAT